MKIDYIVVQAGGKGTRMEQLTVNKPKALVPINNLPMLFHLFKKYPDKKFIIIGDYKIDVLKKYLRAFAKVQYIIVDSLGKKGTCSGVQNAISKIPTGKAFMLIWSDLILSTAFIFPQKENNYLGLAKDFPCRWRYKNNQYEEIASSDYGIAGLFIFENKEKLKNLPLEGELVRWLKEQEMEFETVDLIQTKEYGLILEYRKLEEQKCRPFNRLIYENNKIIKEGIDEQGRTLAIREKRWYKNVQDKGFLQIPIIYSYEPFVMEKIDGGNIYDCQLSYDQKQIVLKKIICVLKELHKLDREPCDYFSLEEAYYGKTIQRLNQIRDLLPFSNQSFITINGKKCPNVFFNYDKLEELCRKFCPKNFVLLHGDCTFSNMMLRRNGEVALIDPRGYFGYTEMNGDVAYDWAKLYYSIVGNYDQFNRKKFKLEIKDGMVTIEIASNHWEDMEKEFFALIADEVSEENVKILHAIIWLSLTTYAWEDYDSICGAFYQGLYYLEEVMF